MFRSDIDNSFIHSDDLFSIGSLRIILSLLDLMVQGVLSNRR